ncbi:MAG: polyamine aminopropyltransferase [Deltaproteobacteria bacterium]|jgi:spermidine synthase|nr:polyamine aminopropyltransferase [Deltaproteobacteria bacterium]
MTYALLLSVFVIASCGLIYELIAGTLASYLLGDSVTQFSTIIGTYLFSMGIGSYLSRFIGRGLVGKFIAIELLVGVIGGYAATVLFLSFAYVGSLKPLLYFLVVVIGILVGLEIPLLLRILKDKLQFKDLVSQVLTFDYLGALAASLLFPILLAPKLGVVRTCLLFGVLNALVAAGTAWLFRRQLPRMGLMKFQCAAAIGLLLAGFAYAERLTSLAEGELYADEIIYARSSPYQRIVITRWKDDVRLFLNGHLQFSSRDEYRYHEALVHPGLQSISRPRQVLVLGGGDGLAVREILKYDSVQTVTLVDLDPEMTRLFSTDPILTRLNQKSLKSPQVKIINADAFLWLEKNQEFFDFVVVDFPDPANYSLGKLYTTAFYRLLRSHLAANGVAVVQSTSPLFARRAYWCIVKTLQSVGLEVTPYHAYVPSFGEWGFVIGSMRPYVMPTQYLENLKFLNGAIAPSFFHFPKDMQPVETEINRLNNQILVQYYESEWRKVTE